jgi:hypothetical protein
MAAKYASNAIEDFEQGGLYPGGSGIIEEIAYVLWDYDGSQPKDSVIAVHVKFQPTDGSNEGKPVDIFWAAGNDVASFAPDPTGGHLVILKTREKQSDNSNWAHVLKRFKDSCGLESKNLNGPTGILALARTEMTVARIDQPTREGLADKAPVEGEKKGFKKTFLVPTKAKFPWEKGNKAGVAVTTKPAATTTTAFPAATAPNGAGEVTTDLSMLIKGVLEDNGGSIEFKALGKALLDKLTGVDRTLRTNLIKEAKDEAKITALAEENGWTFDGKELVI